MERLISYSYEAILVFVLCTCLLLIGQSIALTLGFARLERHRYTRLLPALAALALAFTQVLLLGGSWSLLLADLPPDGWLMFERWWVGLLAAVIAVISLGYGHLSALLLGVAAVLSLPPMDVYFPLNTMLVVLLLSGRLILLAYRARQRPAVTVTSIRAGLDLLPDGLLFARTDGTVVLANITMLDFMQRLTGQQFRNAAVFWQALGAFDDPQRAEKKVRDSAFLFRFTAGDSWLVQRTRLTKGLSGWQLTASCVTELDAVTQELEAKNASLGAVVSAQKELLDTLEQTERHRTLQEITLRVHDVLGQRISMLQQLLASPAPKDALDTIVRIDSLLEAVPLAQEPHPNTLLADMTDTYRRLGVQLSLTGSLPRNLRRARAFAAIIREALSNAVCHGHANEIRITLAERQLRICDNGIGCPGTLHLGSGLRGMMHRMNELGGRLIITSAPHFELDARIGEKDT